MYAFQNGEREKNESTIGHVAFYSCIETFSSFHLNVF